MEVVRQLKKDFPQAVIVANGGITTAGQAYALVSGTEIDEGPGAAVDIPLDGVMIGRTAYHDPWVLHEIEQVLFGSRETSSDPHAPACVQRQDILAPLQAYFERQLALGVAPKHMTRHWHGLFHGQPGARAWRREICEGRLGPVDLFDALLAKKASRPA